PPRSPLLPYTTLFRSLQAVQHRLAQCYQISRAMYYLCLRAAWGADPQLADVAINYAQQHIHKLVFDLHQFNGGMGVTCEHKLHLDRKSTRLNSSHVKI